MDLNEFTTYIKDRSLSDEQIRRVTLEHAKPHRLDDPYLKAVDAVRPDAISDIARASRSRR